MPEFFNVLPPSDALELLRKRLHVRVATERLVTVEALGRVLAEPVSAPGDLPAFARSSMDGFAVRARDTFGASESLPGYFAMIGEVPMGRAPDLSVGVGEAARVHTGGMLAPGADAVVMVENTQVVDSGTIEVMRPAAPGENVVQVGEDVRAGDLALPTGHVLRPQDIGGLAALGVTELVVARQPRVAILSTGDEVVPPEKAIGPGQVRDVNSYTIAGQVQRSGGVAVPLGLVPDDPDTILSAARRGLEEADLLVLSAGSSVSTRDMTAGVIGRLGEPGVLLHGIAIRPGKPTIVALVGDKPVFGLPGNPVSAMIVFDLLVRPTVFLVAGCTHPPAPPTVRARLTRDVPSAAGREDYVPVQLVTRGGEVLAEPVFGKSNLIYTLIRSDGILQVPLDKGGLYGEDAVDVRIY